MIRTLIFDFDGTLADTQVAILRTIRYTLEKMNCPSPSEDHLHQFIGLPLIEIFKKISNSDEPIFLDKCVKIYRSSFDEIGRRFIKLYPGVKETLENFRRQGIYLAIASSRGKQSLLALVKYLNLSPMIDLVLGEEDVNRHKPAPDMAELALASSGSSRQNALVVGDTTYDILMGKAANIHTCGVTYGNHAKEQLLTASPEYLIDSFGLLAKIVNNQPIDLPAILS